MNIYRVSFSRVFCRRCALVGRAWLDNRSVFVSNKLSFVRNKFVNEEQNIPLIDI
jgi:hypothetical protein